MKVVTIIAQVLVGLVFVVFGSNAFLHFIPAVLPPGQAGEFLGILFASKWVLFIGGIQVIGGALLLVNRFVPLGLTLLGPVIFNILLFHGLLSHAGAGPGIVVAILWIFLFWRYSKNFAGIFAAKAM
jgi:putative oxidoreductase